MRAEIRFSGKDSDKEMTSLVARVVRKGGIADWLLLFFNVDDLTDWINLLDVLCYVLILGDVVGGGDGVVRGEWHQLRR